MPQQWRFAEGVWIPKEENASNIGPYHANLDKTKAIISLSWGMGEKNKCLNA